MVRRWMTNWSLGAAILLLGCPAADSGLTPPGPVVTEDTCGNGRLDLVSEDCEGNLMVVRTCAELGRGTGLLRCTATCEFDTSGCGSITTCNDGTVDAGEECDGEDFKDETCNTLGFSDGTLLCTSNCRLNTDGCFGVADADGDGVVDSEDNCPNLANASQLDGDDDSIGNVCDNCPSKANASQVDTDEDGEGDACDTEGSVDRDGDGLSDFEDNCVSIQNVAQEDKDDDGVGDVCDNCPAIANASQKDTDGDKLGDACEGPSAVDGQLRLSGGATQFQGLLEVYHNGQWGTVCDDGFGTVAANIACRQLFGPFYTGVYTAGGNGTGQIWIDDLVCQGSETRLVECNRAAWGVHNCGHSEDIILGCKTF